VKFIPRSYQRASIDFLLKTPKAAFSAQPGLGKTAVALTVIDKLLTKRPEKRVLVIAPKGVLDTNVWQGECDKWDHLQNLRVSAITGSQHDRARILEQRAPLNIINYDLVPWLLEHLDEKWPWDMVVLDEAHRAKRYNGAWFAGKKAKRDENRKLIAPAKRGLKHIAGKTQRWINMSGTPSPHDVSDLWSQTFLLDHGARLGHTISSFRDRWMKKGYDGHSWSSIPGAEREVGAAIADICISLKAADYLDLPDLIQTVVPVAMPASFRPQYKHLQDEFFLRLKNEKVIEAANAAVLSGKLLQATSGFLFTDDRGNYEDVHTAKLDALADLIESLDRPVIVTYHFKPDLARLQKRFKDAVAFDGKPKTIAAFGAGKIPILLMQPASNSEGINGLQAGTDCIIFYGLDWNAGQHDQVIERIGPTRQLQAGHPRPVFVYYMVMQRSVDELVLKRVRDKKSVQDILMDFMKEMKK
jgi:SNF2 family DNA or RNA helicase